VVQIDIVPHGFQRDVRRAHLRDDLLHRGEAGVTPAAKMKTETPVPVICWSFKGLLI
jgi:hypothetical protein